MDLLGGAAFTNDSFGLDADGLTNLLGDLGECGFRLLPRFRPHDLLDTKPLLEVAFGDHVEQHKPAIGILGATTGIVHGPFAFRCVIDNSEKLATMPFQTRQPF
ncbi:hypothetical protein D3C71_448590 [compost metagenome]